MPSQNEIAVYDAILNAEVRISEQLAKDLGAKVHENDDEYRTRERRISSLLLQGTPPSHPEVVVAADMAARAKIKMPGLAAQLRIVHGTLMQSRGVETETPQAWA